jgi:hypothetical protein
MFHIVFDPRGTELLTAAMDMDESLDGEIVFFTDDYSVGPIRDLVSEEGRKERMNWWSLIRNENEKNLPAEKTDPCDADVLQHILKRMEAEEFDQIWIWAAPNARDICGYYWLIAQLGSFSGRIYVIHLNNLPFISEKGTVFYPTALSEIPPREFIKAKRLVRPVTAAEFETDPDEWSRLASENKNLRLLEGGKKIIQQADDYYDKSVLHFLQPVFQKIPRTIHQFLQKSQEKLNESFLIWRLKQLVAAGEAEQQGETIRLFVNTAEQTVPSE